MVPDGGAPAPHVPLVLPDEALPLTKDGRRVRAADEPARVSPLRALAGAALAVAGVVLGIGALLSVTGDPGGDPTLSGAALDVAAPLPPAAAPAPAAAAPAPPTPEPTTPVATPAPTAPAAAPAAPRTAAATARAAVTVLNNSTRTGLADRAAARFARNGWPVRLVGNFRGQLRATTVYYEPGQRAAAQRFAATFRGIDRVLPRPSNIPGPRGLVVVLTRSFPA